MFRRSKTTMYNRRKYLQKCEGVLTVVRYCIHVGTHRWSYSLWISKWTLSWTQCPRIHHPSHLDAKFSFELLMVRVTDPPLATVKTPAPSLFFLSYSMPSTLQTSYPQGLLSIPRKGVNCFLLCHHSSDFAQQEQHCSTLESQPSTATISNFSSETSNVELGFDSIAQHCQAQDF